MCCIDFTQSIRLTGRAIAFMISYAIEANSALNVFFE
jgi:hypothetical protein